MNPLDVEEIVWDIACQNRMKLQNSNYAIKQMSLPPGKTDRRKIMVSICLSLSACLYCNYRTLHTNRRRITKGTVYSLYRGDGASEEDLATAGHSGR